VVAGIAPTPITLIAGTGAPDALEVAAGGFAAFTGGLATDSVGAADEAPSVEETAGADPLAVCDALLRMSVACDGEMVEVALKPAPFRMTAPRALLFESIKAAVGPARMLALLRTWISAARG
jgi:hypothetical protein